jgi:4-amino-4-deoxy-L-arabinose transferase-like glycosyltransferase
LFFSADEFLPNDIAKCYFLSDSDNLSSTNDFSMPLVHQVSIKLLKRPRLAGLLAFLMVAFGITFPGITIDEPLDVAPGRHYWDVLAARGIDFFSAAGVKQAFGGNPDHPPLPRWCLGAASHLFQTLQIVAFGHGDPTGTYVVAGRVAPALAFGLTVALIAAWSARNFSNLAGWCAGLSLLLMPRLFGHAHLAALETILNFFTTAAMLSWIDLLIDPSAKKFRDFLKASVFLGFALLCKIQAWLLGPWLLGLLVWIRPPGKKMSGSVAAGGASISVWFAGWPWLWYESADRLREYFFRSVDRISLKVLYFGQIYDDRALPWHYTTFQVATAIPLGIWFLIILGGYHQKHLSPIDRSKLVSLAALVLFIVVVFSMKVTRYDSDRLVLMVYPPLAVFAGVGASRLVISSGARLAPKAGTFLLVLIFTASANNLLKPYPLSYFNLLVGGTQGAASLGIEPTFWADTVDQSLLEELVKRFKDGDSVALVPTLHGSQAIMTTPYIMIAKGQKISDQSSWQQADYLLVYRREAYWPKGLSQWLETNQPLAQSQRDGVWLGGLWHGPGRKRSGENP